MRAIAAALAFLALAQGAAAYDPVEIDYSASVTANASTGDFAPYMLASWNYGRITGASGIWHDGLIRKEMTLDRRFNWGAGVEYIAGYGTAADYKRYLPDGSFTTNANRQAPVRLQQLYAELKYRGVYLTAGMKERGPGYIVDGTLSSGDLTRSNNARPMPGVAVGFVDFQNIPFTNGWVQIDGEIMYGRFMDKSYLENTFNYYTGMISPDNWYIYRRCYFRTKPSQPFSVIVGMQAAGQFAGYSKRYKKGKLTAEEMRGFHFKDIFEMFFPQEGSGEGFYKGNSLGSWDFKARYLFKNGSQLSAYFEWPWEDGSGIGKKTGWDGLWGLQYDFKEGSPIRRIVAEYFDFTNQSGPIHYAPNDHPGTDLTTEATGGDNYYNNDFYGPYSYYGMSIGSPFPVSPLYNLDGYAEYAHNRARGFHLAALADIGSQWQCVAKVSYQQAGGSGRLPSPRRYHDISAMVGAQWTPGARLSGFSVKAQLAFDAGNLRGDNFGGMLTVAYSGLFKIGRK